jgi:hypothetical protein
MGVQFAAEGKLYSIDPQTGTASVVGVTGLGDCTTPASPCGPNFAVMLGLLAGNYYALDFSQNLYSLDPVTGAAKLIGAHRDPTHHVCASQHRSFGRQAERI